MLDVQVYKLETTGVHCANPDCKKDPKHMINIIGRVWHIKTDTTVASITLKGNHETYCRGCIPEVYQMIKSKLDPKLWAFH